MPTEKKTFKISVSSVDQWGQAHLHDDFVEEAISAEVAVSRAVRSFRSDTVPKRERIAGYRVEIVDPSNLRWNSEPKWKEDLVSRHALQELVQAARAAKDILAEPEGVDPGVLEEAAAEIERALVLVE